MRRRSISTATALAVLFGSAALAVGTAGTASADSAKVLAVKSVGDVVVDGVHQRVYVSDPTSGKIQVTDYSGTLRATLAGEPGVTGLALSADSGTLYAAVKNGQRIDAIDTQTITPKTSYPLGTTAPSDLEIVDGRIWFSTATDFGSLDISGAEPVIHLGQRGDVDFSGSYGTFLASDPAVPGVLVAGNGGNLAVYDVSADGATLRTKGSVDTNTSQIDLTPDGKHVLTSWGDPDFGYGIGEYSTTDLSKESGYPIDAYPNAVRVAPDGTVAGGSDSWYEPDVHIYRPGDQKPVREYDFPNTGTSSGSDTLVAGALAWAPDESRVFAVSVNNLGVFTLRALTDPTKELPALKVTAPATATRAKKLTVTGKLTSRTALPAGTALTVTRTDLDSPNGKTLPVAKTKADGTFSFTDTPPAGGKVTYKVAFAGDATHAAVSASDAVEVSRSATTLTLNNNGKLYSYGKDVKFTAHLGKTYKNRKVEIWANPFGGDKPNKLIKTGTVNSSGNFSATVHMTRDSDVTAVFKGDSRYKPKTAKVTAYAKVKVSTAVTKHYKTAKIGSHTYYWFHKNKSPIVTTTMTYYPGRQQRLELEVYYQGQWYPVEGSPEYFALGTNGKSAVSLGAAGTSGIKARVRSAYINGASGDTVNSTTYTGWKYIYFSN